MLKKIIQISKEVYLHMGGLNFDEKDFQLAFGYELDKSKIDYMREISLEVFYKDIPVKLGSPDFFLNKSKPPLILELKLSSAIQNSHRQQLKMYLVSVKRKPKSVVAKIKIACFGGSSRVFKKALNAELESMCASSMI